MNNEDVVTEGKTGEGAESVEDILLNGAQIQSAVSIVDSFNSGTLSYKGALEMLVTFLNIPEDKARIMLNNGIPSTKVEEQEE